MIPEVMIKSSQQGLSPSSSVQFQKKYSFRSMGCPGPASAGPLSPWAKLDPYNFFIHEAGDQNVGAIESIVHFYAYFNYSFGFILGS